MKRTTVAGIGLALVVLACEALIYAKAADHIAPAYVPEQSQAAALAVPEPVSAPPASLVVVTVCNQIVGIVASDTEGHIHPLNIEGLGEGRLKSIIAHVPERIVVQAPCHAEPDKQPIF